MTLIGTSGYNYKEWKGLFYPADLPASKMLKVYSDQFPTVEINYSFYRIPSEKVIADWSRRRQTRSPSHSRRRVASRMMQGFNW